jgi:methionyl-tRNA synthetase
MRDHIYITTTLPYINAAPHIGFAAEIVRADAMSRWYKKQGKKVFLNTGTDEHGMKIYRKAEEQKMTAQQYSDLLSEQFKALKELLTIEWDAFTRTTDSKHQAAAQEFWRRCLNNGYIYKKNYKIRYCVGCELEKTDSEIIDGHCYLHPSMELEIIEEENYFFKFSAFGEKLLDFYEKNPEFVVPQSRYHEIKNFVKKGLEDFSISRLKAKMPWGIDVPDDSEHVMYVWFDALVNYVSAIGWPENQEEFEKWWPAVQWAGKDNLRQQSAMWQAMLMAAGLPQSEKIYINGFITVGGQKMSKSLGNVISPGELTDKFGSEATRYLLLTLGVFGEDADVTWERMIEKYNADLANGLGNLVARSAKLAEKLADEWIDEKSMKAALQRLDVDALNELVAKGKLEQLLNYVWILVKEGDCYIEDKKPWELVRKNIDQFNLVMKEIGMKLYVIAYLLEPFMPNTGTQIQRTLAAKDNDVFFPRVEECKQS